jgi:hypothetical protein
VGKDSEGGRGKKEPLYIYLYIYIYIYIHVNKKLYHVLKIYHVHMMSHHVESVSFLSNTKIDNVSTSEWKRRSIPGEKMSVLEFLSVCLL